MLISVELTRAGGFETLIGFKMDRSRIIPLGDSNVQRARLRHRQFDVLEPSIWNLGNQMRSIYECWLRRSKVKFYIMFIALLPAKCAARVF